MARSRSGGSDGAYRIGDWRRLVKETPAESFDAVVTDPPYGRVTDNAWDRAPSWTSLGMHARRLLRGDAPPLVAFGRVPENLAMALGFAAAGWELRDEFVWVKGNVAIWTGGKKPRHVHESVWWFLPRGARMADVFWDEAAVTAPRKEVLSARRMSLSTSQQYGTFRRLAANRATVAPPSIISCPPTRGTREHVGHPTQKPIAVLQLLIRLLVPPGGRVLDPFAGSGSTIRAALACGRRAEGWDADPRWEGHLRAACATRSVLSPKANMGRADGAKRA